jgi:exonuclease SbcC
MRAFGSYGKLETIDFTELGDKRLFLIHGPTGSGKTTVLDAICFALYGVATGEDRDAKGFRSDFADPTEITEVTFDFSIGERVFRIVRQPEQERAKKRGEGTTRSPVAATMWERTGVDDDEEGAVLAGKWSEVTAKVEILLGFRSEQFRQVIVLPQGRFLDLLMASSKSREEILQQLFDTSFYRKIQNSLKERAKQLADDRKQQQTRREVLLEQCDCEDEADLAALLKVLDKDLEDQSKRAKEAGTKSKAAQKKLTEAAGLEQRYALQDQITAAIADLEKQSKFIATERKRLELANKAASLSDFFSGVQHARKANSDAEDLAVEAAEDARASKEAQDKARKEHEAQKGREGERKALEKRLAELERIRPVVAALTKERADRDVLKGEFDATDKKLGQQQKAKKDLKKQADKATEEIKELKGKLRDRELLEKLLKEAEKRLEASGTLAKMQEEVAAVAKSLKTYTSSAAEKDKELKALRRHLQLLVEQRQAGSAAMLAKDLEPGSACPVCGSTEHPELATSAAEIPDDDAIDDARIRVEEAEKALNAENKAVAKAQSLHVKLQAELKGLQKEAGDQGADSKKAKAAEVKARQDLEQHDRVSTLLAKKSSELVDLETQREDNESKLESLQKSHGDLSKSLSAAEARLEEKEKAAGKEFENESSVELALSEAQKTLQASRVALEAATENERNASSEHVKAEVANKHAKKLSVAAAKEAASKEKEWVVRLEKGGFKSEKAFVAADLADESRSEIQDALEEYDRNYAEAKVRAKDIAAELKEKKRPDIDSLQAAATELDAARSAADEAVVANREKIKELNKTTNLLKKLAKELAALDEKYGVLGTLADTADGRNSLRVSLQRFVLATRLDDVLISASRRLSMMTRGRFKIQRNTTSDDKRAAGGLELEVDDAYTGSCRPVSTLSGGESFQAALALALGLSEVVQAYAGGIRLDTIFVDEGFGSLDPEALELAINTLIDLQATGRLVGVISHVPELKERIDVRLQIKAGRSGSTAAFQLP